MRNIAKELGGDEHIRRRGQGRTTKAHSQDWLCHGVMENEPRNLTIGTLIRVAHALDSRVEIKLVRRKKGVGRGRKGG